MYNYSCILQHMVNQSMFDSSAVNSERITFQFKSESNELFIEI